MIINIKLEDNSYNKTTKDISKIIKWANKYHKKYFNIISGVDNCVLINKPAETKSLLAAWFTFDSLHTSGAIENLKLVMTNNDLMDKLYKISAKIKLDCRIDTFDNTPFGISPFFVFSKNDIEYFVVIARNSIDISVASN
jgi:hypothetical protein